MLPDPIKRILNYFNTSFSSRSYLLGGAPRDLFLNRLPKDYDIYLYDSQEEITTSYIKNLSNEFTNVRMVDISNYAVSTGLPIRAIYTFDYFDFKIELIVLYDELCFNEILDTFSCTLSKFYYDTLFETVVPTREAKLAVATKSLVFSDNCTPSYKTKISNYFNDYIERDELQIAYHLIDKAINSVSDAQVQPSIVSYSTPLRTTYFYRA